MKLPDFSENNGLNALRQQMGAELISWKSGGDWDRIDIELDGDGKEIPPEEIEYAPDRTLEYKGRKVVVYIRDQSNRDQYVLDSDESIAPEHLCKFHVANCPTLSQMHRQGRYDRYVVATRRDGKFTVNFLNGGKPIKKGVECRLYVCKRCLNTLNYQNYRNRRTQQGEIRESFDLNEFFEMYPSQITRQPTGTDITAPVNKYSRDWDQISHDYKEKMEWKCEECSENLAARTEFLHVHHIDTQKSNNREENLRALCIRCHAEMPGHQHFKSNPKYKEYLCLLDR